MIKSISRRYATLLAVTFVACAILGYTTKGYGQNTCVPCNPINCPCNDCLSAAIEINPLLCTGGCPGCITWVIQNNCCSCITSITLDDKPNNAFTTCCVVIKDVSHASWTVTQLNPHKVTYTAPPGTDCLANGMVIQITTCGIPAGDPVTVDWTPDDAGCSGPQGEIVYMP
jgi:hypothetical protein